MKDYKKLLKLVVLLISHPARAWLHISHKGTRKGLFSEFIYPMIMLSSLAAFLGLLFGNGIGWESFYPAMMQVGVITVALYISFYFSSYITGFLTKKYMKIQYSDGVIECFTGYSMVVVFSLNVLLGLFPNFFILAWLAQFYTVKIVWDGAAILMKIPEKKRLGYTLMVSAVILLIPLLTKKLMVQLSLLFG